MLFNNQKIDSLGKLSLPTFIVSDLELIEGSNIELFITGGKLHIRKFDEIKYKNNPLLFKSKGTIFTLDNLKRVPIPNEFLDILEIKPNQLISLFYDSSKNPEIIVYH